MTSGPSLHKMISQLHFPKSEHVNGVISNLKNYSD